MESVKLTILGSANVDFFIAVERLPEVGETIGSKSLEVKSGGKAANQAAACALLGAKSKFVAQLGSDPYAEMLLDGIFGEIRSQKIDLRTRGVNVDNVIKLKDVSCGQAYIFSLPNGNNSIVLNGGANMAWNKDKPLNDAQINAIKDCIFLINSGNC